jgi:hypothetical protein
MNKADKRNIERFPSDWMAGVHTPRLAAKFFIYISINWEMVSVTFLLTTFKP